MIMSYTGQARTIVCMAPGVALLHVFIIPGWKQCKKLRERKVGQKFDEHILS